MEPTIITAVISAVVAVVTAFFTWIVSTKKIKLDDRAELSKDIAEHVNRLEARIDVLSNKIDKYETERDQIKDENLMLRSKVAELELELKYAEGKE